MSFTRRVAALTLVAAAMLACGGTRPTASTQPAAPNAATDAPPQPTPSSGSPLAHQATASLAGTITTATDGSPIAGARVTVTSQGRAEARAGMTDADGRYEIRDLPAGTYVVEVSRTGYVPQRFGERRGAPPAAVSLSAGQRLTTIDIALAPAAAIAGRVLDEDGTALAGATVTALVPRIDHGQRVLAAASTAHTGERGEFRLTGLAPGHYYVSALKPALANAGQGAEALRYTPTYFPGAATIDEAKRITVPPGGVAERIEFRLQLVRPSVVSGRLTTPDGQQLVSAAVIMTPLSGESLAPIPPHDVDILPDGRFTFRNVPPGRYQLRARANTRGDGVTLLATFLILVDGRDLTDITMLLGPGASISGILAVDSQVTPRAILTGIRIGAPFVDGSMFGDLPTGDVAPDGTFQIHGVMPGAHYLTLEGLPSPWVLKSVAYRGRDITDLAIDVGPGDQFRDVRVTVTDRASEVTGTVRDERGAPVDAALVVVLPPEAALWTRANRRFRVVRCDGSGRYRLRGLPAGEYRAVATTELDESDVYGRDMIAPLLDAAVSLRLAQEGTRILDLTLAVPPYPRSSTR